MEDGAPVVIFIALEWRIIDLVVLYTLRNW